MPLDFKPQPGSAVDPGTGLTIHAPRMSPAPPPADAGHTEYQYNFRFDGQWFYGIGLNGSDEVVERAGRREWMFRLDLGRDWVLDTVFELKRMLGNSDEDFVFLQGMAQGLVRVFEKDTNHDYDFRYLALTDAGLLAQRGIMVLGEVARLPTGEIVLADVFVPAQAEGDDKL